MTKDQYKESCARLGVPYSEEEFIERQKDYLTSLLEKPALGVKYDKDKPMWSLVPMRPMEEVVGVLTYGAQKYSPDNWKNVDDAEQRYFNAAMRHIWAWRQGEQFDIESHKSHLAHAMCCLLFLMAFDNEKEHCDSPF